MLFLFQTNVSLVLSLPVSEPYMQLIALGMCIEATRYYQYSFPGGNVIMNLLSDYLQKGLVQFLNLSETSAQDICNAYFDEPEVPQELIHQKVCKEWIKIVYHCQFSIFNVVICC